MGLEQASGRGDRHGRAGANRPSPGPVGPRARLSPALHRLRQGGAEVFHREQLPPTGRGSEPELVLSVADARQIVEEWRLDRNQRARTGRLRAHALGVRGWRRMQSSIKREIGRLRLTYRRLNVGASQSIRAIRLESVGNTSYVEQVTVVQPRALYRAILGSGMREKNDVSGRASAAASACGSGLIQSGGTRFALGTSSRWRLGAGLGERVGGE